MLPPKEIQNNVYIRKPVELEQYLMEGSYNKVFLSKGSVPADSYTFFIDILLDTIRDEIAGCIEKTFDQISVNEAARLLFFNDAKQFGDFAVKRQWRVAGNLLKFNDNVTTTQSSINRIPAETLAVQAIEYAKELEMIV